MISELIVKLYILVIDSLTRHWTGSSLIHAMACQLFCAMPLPEPEPMMAYCKLDP